MQTASKNVMIGMVSLQTPDNVTQEIIDYENLLEKKVASVLRYMTWEESFPEGVCNAIAGRDAVPMLIWMPNWPSTKGNERRECPMNETGLDEILSGVHDGYIEQFARDVQKWNKTLLIRFLYEFNANWYVWGGYKNGGANGGPEKVKSVWKYVVGKFRELGVQNAQWVWCPHETSDLVSPEPWNDIEHYWPGDEWVDWLGIDGFNFYPENPERVNPALLSFDILFREMHKKLRALSNKPIQIMTGSGEFVSEHNPINKIAWVNDMCSKLLNDYEGMVLFYWFHHQFNDKSDWRINSSPESLTTFREQMQKPNFSSTFQK